MWHMHTLRHIHTHRQSGFTAYVSVFYGRAAFNYLLQSFSGHSGVSYQHTLCLLSSNQSNTINSFLTEALAHLLDDLRPADPLEDVGDE